MAGTAKKIQTPKAKRKAKRKEEEAKKKAAEAEEEANEIEFEKAVLEIRVKELETLNLGLKRKCDYLESQNNVYKTQLEETKDEKEDLVTYLTKSLTEEKTIVKELEDRLIGMQQARIDDTKSFELKLVKKAEEFEEMKTKLERRILELGVKITSIEEFQVQKIELMKKFECLQEQLENERKSFRLEYDELETKMIRYREKVKNDAIETLVNMAKDVQKAGKLCLTGTVKSAIAANIRLNEELEIVSRDNLNLRERLTTLTMKLQEALKTTKTLITEKLTLNKECSQYRTIIERLAMKQVEMDAKIKTTNKITREFTKLKSIHSHCKTETQIDQMLKDELQVLLNKKSQAATRVDTTLDREIKKLQSIIVKTAITAKEMTEACNAEEMEFLRSRFKTMIMEVYDVACEIPGLSSEIKSKLFIPVPRVLPFVEFK